MQSYEILDIDENVDESANILVRAQGTYFLLMNLREGGGDAGAVYDLLIGHESEGGEIDWLKETESDQKYIDILEAVIDDILGEE